MGHLLEMKLSIWNTNTHVSACIRVPDDLCCGAFNIVWILEYHNGLCVDRFAQMFWLLTCEILFEQVDFIVLHDAFDGVSYEILCGRGIAQNTVS